MRFSDEQERYVDNDAANEYLTRPYREGFEVPGVDELTAVVRA